MTSLSDVLNSATAFTQTAIQPFADYEKQRVVSALTMKENQLAVDTNRFMNELQNDGDYENYQQKMDDYFSKLQNSAKDKKSPFSSRSYFEQQKTSQMIDAAKAKMQMNLDNMVNNKRREEATVNDQKTIELAMDQFNSGMIKADEALGNIGVTLRTMKKEGRLSESDYDKLTKQYQDQVIISDKLNRYNIDRYLNDGKSLEDLLKDYDADKTEYEYIRDGIKVAEPETLKAPEKEKKGMKNEIHAELPSNQTAIDVGSGKPVEKTDFQQLELKKKIRDELTSRYKTKLKALQDQGDKGMYKLHTDILTTEDASKALNMTENALTTLESMNDNQISPEDRNKWTKILTSCKDNIENSGSPFGKPGSKGALKSTSALVENQPETLLQLVKEGKISAIDAERQLQEFVKERFFSKDWKETIGMSPEEKQNYYEDNLKELGKIEFFSDKVLNMQFKQHPELKLKVDEAKKELAKCKDIKGLDYFMAIVNKSIFEMDENTDIDELNKFIDKQKNAIILLNMKDEYQSANLAKATEFTNENDMIFTDEYGKLRMAPGYDKVLENARDKQRQDLGNRYGIKEDRIDSRLEVVDGDPTGKWIHRFIDRNGEPVEFMYDNSGKVIKKANATQTSGEKAKTQKEVNAEYNAELKAQQKQAKQDTRLEAKKTNQALEERAMDLQTAYEGKKKTPSMIVKSGRDKYGQWETSNFDDKSIIMNDSINKIDRDAKKMDDKKFKDKYGVEKAEWDKLKSSQEKINFILDN